MWWYTVTSKANIIVKMVTMSKYSAFSIDRQTLEKLRVISEEEKRSMASQVRFWVDREYQSFVDRRISKDLSEQGPGGQNGK